MSAILGGRIPPFGVAYFRCFGCQMFAILGGILPVFRVSDVRHFRWRTSGIWSVRCPPFYVAYFRCFECQSARRSPFWVADFQAKISLETTGLETTVVTSEKMIYKLFKPLRKGLGGRHQFDIQFSPSPDVY